ncbi:MAG: universal stress protein [Deltaproteobacteria bacterium]|nr:MAG: universal stress protein [Deltaproteobacteria bacterium]
MFDTILYPTDFSDSAAKSVTYIKALRSAGATKVLLVNVIHQRVLDTLDTMQKVLYYQDARLQGDTEEAIEKLAAERRKKMEPIVTVLEAAGFEVETKILKGYPVKEILRTEKEEDISVIVLGSHGRSNFRRARLGSVSEKVIRRAKAPVLLIKR